MCLSAATLVGAEDEDDGGTAASWLNQTIAQCQQEYDEQSCQDPEFLEQHYHVRTLQIAHKASIRHTQEERRALGELMLQRLCSQDLKKYCAVDGSTDCIPRTQQTCANIQRYAVACVTNAQQFCAENPQDGCLQSMGGHCPTSKKLNIDVLLAKYPKLTGPQQTHIRQVAAQIDASTRGLIGDLLSWFGFNN